MGASYFAARRASSGVAPIVRDATLAALSGVALLSLLTVTDSLAALTRPGAAVVGIVVALGVEWLFLAETPVAELWDRRAVRTGTVIALISTGGFVLVSTGPWLVAAACWGLATYFSLLGLLLAGVWTPDTETSARRSAEDEDPSE